MESESNIDHLLTLKIAGEAGRTPLGHHRNRLSNLELCSGSNQKPRKTLFNSCVVFIITGVLDRVRIKYKDRGYRFILLEAGHLAQNLMLLAEELGLCSCAIGGYIDDEVNKLLDIQHTKEVTLYLIAVGKV